MIITPDKNIIITGGAKGFGKATTLRLLKKGCRLAIIDIDGKALLDLKKEHEQILIYECDITDYKQVSATVASIFEEVGQIDVLINNAGILYSSPLVSFSMKGIRKHSVDSWKKVIDLNLNAVFFMSVEVAEKMIQKRTKGVIVNISSVCWSGNAGQSAYSASKSAVNSLTATWAKELGMMGIRVCSVAPGFSDTESTHDALDKEIIEQWVAKVPLRRLGNVEEIVSAIIWSIENDFFTGKVLEIDGGLRI